MIPSMKQLNVEIEESVHQKAKVAAAREGRTLQAWVGAVIRDAVSQVEPGEQIKLREGD